jgi:hypothetical protein
MDQRKLENVSGALLETGTSKSDTRPATSTGEAPRPGSRGSRRAAASVAGGRASPTREDGKPGSGVGASPRPVFRNDPWAGSPGAAYRLLVLSLHLDTEPEPRDVGRLVHVFHGSGHSGVRRSFSPEECYQLRRDRLSSSGSRPSQARSSRRSLRSQRSRRCRRRCASSARLSMRTAIEAARKGASHSAMELDCPVFPRVAGRRCRSCRFECAAPQLVPVTSCQTALSSPSTYRLS